MSRGVTTPADPVEDGQVEDDRVEGDQTVDQIAAAVLAVEGVDDLHGGALGEVATYLPGRRVAGVRLRGDDAEVHVVTEWGTSVLEVGQRVRAAVEKLVAGSVAVTIEDVADPAGTGASGRSRA